ncbi:hypothetical protein, partial [Staphylococcus aureus]
LEAGNYYKFLDGKTFMLKRINVPGKKSINDIVNVILTYMNVLKEIDPSNKMIASTRQEYKQQKAEYKRHQKLGT